MPEDGGCAIEVRGDLAAILALGAERKRPAGWPGGCGSARANKVGCGGRI